MDTVLLIKLNTAAYDYYLFLFSWLETDKNPAAFKLLKSRRLNSIFCVDNQSELVPLKSVEQGFFKWPVILQMFSAAVLFFSSIHFWALILLCCEGTEKITKNKFYFRLKKRKLN